jgi:hypothetical protein
MGAKRTIKAKTMVADIRAGLSESELTAKYGLSITELKRIVESLAQAGRLRGSEVQEWRAASERSAGKSGTRELPRAYLRIPPEISDGQDRTNRGLVTDISIRGFRTRGVVARVGDLKIFRIHASDIADTDDIDVIATCTWYSAKTSDRTLQEAGFRIDRVSDAGAMEIRKLIEHLSLGDRNRRRG